MIDATLALIADPDTPLEELMRIIPGPDFPTGGLILGRSGIRSAFETGRGSIPLRARCEIEEMRGGRQCIVVSEIPYQVNKATLLERIAELVRAKQVEGISDLRDESDRDGMRIVIELKRDATAEVVLNQLYRMTQLQTSFAVNFLALDDGRPRQMGLRDALLAFIALPRGGDPPPQPLPPGQGAGARAPADRPRHRGGQHRRGDPPDPRQPRPGRGARRADGARLAGGRCRRAAGAGGGRRQHRGAPTARCG